MTVAAQASWEWIESPVSFGELEDRISVLFIQDDPDIAEMYRMKLNLDGYDVTVLDADEVTTTSLAQSGAEIAFVDIRVPHRDRSQVLRKLRTSNTTRGLPVIILTDYNQDELKGVGINVKPADFLVVNLTTPTRDRQLRDA